MNLENLEVVELTTEETVEVDGGFCDDGSMAHLEMWLIC